MGGRSGPRPRQLAAIPTSTRPRGRVLFSHCHWTEYRAKPFVDVTIDRAAKAGGALLALILSSRGIARRLALSKYASLISPPRGVLAMRARAQYLKAFRRKHRGWHRLPETLQLDATDAATIECSSKKLSSPDPACPLCD